MRGPVWHSGPLPVTGFCAADAPVAWYMQLDTQEASAIAAQATLSRDDLTDLATRPDAAMRAMRRKLAKVLLGAVDGIHPDRVIIRRSPHGAPLVETPRGWHISLAGQWPHCLIALARTPLGADIEPLDAPPPPEDMLTARERGYLERPSIDADRSALRFWVTKEAHAKSTGLANLADPAAIESGLGEEGVETVCARGRSRCWLQEKGSVLQAVALRIVQDEPESQA